MEFNDRFLSLLVGGAFGYILGYLTSWVRVTNDKLATMKNELDGVSEILSKTRQNPKTRSRKRDERGAMTADGWTSVALIIVVAFTAFSAFQSQRALNGYKDTQNQQQALTACTARILKDTIATLDVRSNFVRKQASANVDLQRAQSEMIAILLHEPPYTDERQLAAFKTYFDALNSYVSASDKAEQLASEQPYPTITEFNTCISEEISKGG